MIGGIVRIGGKCRNTLGFDWDLVFFFLQTSLLCPLVRLLADITGLREMGIEFLLKCRIAMFLSFNWSCADMRVLLFYRYRLI